MEPEHYLPIMMSLCAMTGASEISHFCLLLMAHLPNPHFTATQGTAERILDVMPAGN